MLYSLFRLLFAFLLTTIFRIRIRVKGREHLPKEGGFILASNHVSYLDPIVLAIASCRRLDFMAKQDLFSHPVLAWWMRSVGVVPVKRDSADLGAIKEAMRRIRKGRVLTLFPEGSRSDGKHHTEPQSGVGFLAIKANAPVIPAFISGTALALPKGAKFIRPARISVCFGRQISLERRMPYQDFAQLIMESIRSLSC